MMPVSASGLEVLVLGYVALILVGKSDIVRCGVGERFIYLILKRWSVRREEDGVDLVL